MKLISMFILASLCMSNPRPSVSVHDDTTQSTQVDTICYIYDSISDKTSVITIHPPTFKDTTLQPTIYKNVYIREEPNHVCPW